MQRLVIVFLHVSSAMGIVAGFGIEGLVLLQLHRARGGAEARVVLSSYRYVQRVGATSLIAAIVTGVFLATVYWGWRGAWMGVGFLTLVAIAVVGATMTARPMTRALRANSTNSNQVSEIARLPGSLTMSFSIRLALFAGIVFLMTVKPVTGIPALLTVAIAAALGLAIGFPARRQGATVPNEQNVPAR